MRARAVAGILLTLASVLVLGVSAAPGDENESSDRPLQQAAISAGGTHACAVAADGSVRCWGSDSEGELGDGGTTAGVNSAPVGAVALGQPVRAISAGSGFTCALLTDANVRCWGNDGAGQLGDGGTTSGTNASPVGVVALGQGVRAISAGGSHACALLSDATVRCWGQNVFGQLGNGGPATAVNSAPVAAVALGQPAIAISAGHVFSCALLVDRTVRCWGYDSDGELGDGGTTTAVNASPAAAVALGQPVVAVSAGGDHACALLVDRTVRCWGGDANGQLGDGGTTSAVNSSPGGVVALGQPVSAITADGSSTCALLADGVVRCWGWGVYGQLGDGTNAGQNPIPGGSVALGQSARALTAGGLGSCALLVTGAVRCWGYDVDGELGDGGTTAVVNAAPAGIANLPRPASTDSADLSLAATANSPSATVGDQATITLTLTNSGVDATTAIVAAPLGAGLAPVAAIPSDGAYNAATGLWKTSAIPAGATRTLTLTAAAIASGSSSTTVEVVDASAQDPDSTPADGVAGEDDEATATIAVAPSPVIPGATPPKVKLDRISIALKPRRDTKAPFEFAPTAKLTITKAPLATACNGTVTFTAMNGKKKVLTQRAPLRLKSGVCSATTKTKIRKRPGKARSLAFSAAFAGNALLVAGTSKPTTARLR